MSIKATKTTTPMLPKELKNKPCMHWKREDILKYAEYIKKAMENWEACTHFCKDQGLVVSTTPKPNPTITIIDAITKKYLYPQPSNKKNSS
jgi:sialic acid synthase SpsE